MKTQHNNSHERKRDKKSTANINVSKLWFWKNMFVPARTSRLFQYSSPLLPEPKVGIFRKQKQKLAENVEL